MRVSVIALVALLVSACSPAAPPPGQFLFVWAGDSAQTESDFLAVLDADPASSTYGTVVASLPTGGVGSHPHHTEPTVSAENHLLANGFAAGRTWLFDLAEPRVPKILASFDALDGFSNPHSFLRLPNGNVLATFQYRADTGRAPMAHGPGGMGTSSGDVTGGLVEMTERGEVIQSRSAQDPSIGTTKIFPYSALPFPDLDRVLSTTTNMSEADSSATSEWIQFWRLSDLTLLTSVALSPGPRGNEHHFSGEPLLLADGKSAYVHTFNCGLYLVRDIAGDRPTTTFVYGFEGQYCGVPVRTGGYWVQTVPEAHAVVVLDIRDPDRPKEVSRVVMGNDEEPHWLAIDPTGRRLVMNSAGWGGGNRLYLLNLDPATGKLTIDDQFRDPGSDRPGVAMRGKQWPHGFTGIAVPHGTVFSN